MGLFMAIGPRNDRVRVTLPSKEWIQATIDNAGVGIDVTQDMNSGAFRVFYTAFNEAYLKWARTDGHDLHKCIKMIQDFWGGIAA